MCMEVEEELRNCLLSKALVQGLTVQDVMATITNAWRADQTIRYVVFYAMLVNFFYFRNVIWPLLGG